MSEQEPLELLPPEIGAHPDLDFNCPHCAALLSIALADLYRFAARGRGRLDSPVVRVDVLRYMRRRMTCAACNEFIDLQLEPVVTWQMHACTPDPEARMMGDGILIGGTRFWRPETPTVKL